MSTTLEQPQPDSSDWECLVCLKMNSNLESFCTHCGEPHSDPFDYDLKENMPDYLPNCESDASIQCEPEDPTES